MTLTIELPEEKQQALAAKAQAAGLPVEGYARQLIERDLIAGPEAEPDRRPIWEAILDRSKALPPEAFERLPADGASQVDHYLYGHPKR